MATGTAEDQVVAADGHGGAGFVKALSRFDATALVAGSMIGSAIFIVPADILRQVGSPGLFLVVWAVIGYPWLPGFFLLFTAVLSVNLLIQKPQYTWPCLFIVALGIPLFFFRSRGASVWKGMPR